MKKNRYSKVTVFHVFTISIYARMVDFKFKIMEEVEGFEPPRAFTPLSVFKTDPFSRTWVYLRKEI